MASERPFDISGLLEWARQKLKSAEIDDFEISSEIILCHILNLSRADLLAGAHSKPNSDIINRYKSAIEKRSRHVPLQYITGVTEFYNVSIKCDSRALIPRPETEILVETVIGELKSEESPTILDIGTGSGNIVIALAANIKSSRAVGMDISGGAIALAVENTELNGLSTRIKFVKGSIEDKNLVASLGRFDCVVSNPPYVSEDDRQTLQPEITEYEPPVALFSPGDPLRFFKLIMEIAPSILHQGGLMAFEVGYGQAEDVAGLMSSKEFSGIERIRDLAGIERVVIGRSVKENRI